MFPIFDEDICHQTLFRTLFDKLLAYQESVARENTGGDQNLTYVLPPFLAVAEMLLSSAL